jgi:hypothetical protein
VPGGLGDAIAEEGEVGEQGVGTAVGAVRAGVRVLRGPTAEIP